ncbi:MAG: hypothetical protein ACRDUY_09300 [Nitriliruptorales bacterium]
MIADLVLLALEEGLPGTHIAADLALPLGILFFGGSVYVLVWSVYGAKKGALVYGTAFFAFAMMMGVFWWFGAPGTPVATGLRYFPGQATDTYDGKWFAMEPGSERAENFTVTNALDNFQTPEEHFAGPGTDPEAVQANPGFRSLSGDLFSAAEVMLPLFLPTNEQGAAIIGAERRAQLLEEAEANAPEGFTQASPFFTARVKPSPDDESDPEILVTEEHGLRVAAAPLQVLANYTGQDEEGKPTTEVVVVEEGVWFAFKDPGALWFPSAVWTLTAAALFGLCLFGLDRIEQREKERVAEREPVAA